MEMGGGKCDGFEELAGSDVAAVADEAGMDGAAEFDARSSCEIAAIPPAATAPPPLDPPTAAPKSVKLPMAELLVPVPIPSYTSLEIA